MPLRSNEMKNERSTISPAKTTVTGPIRIFGSLFLIILGAMNVLSWGIQIREQLDYALSGTPTLIKIKEDVLNNRISFGKFGYGKLRSNRDNFSLEAFLPRFESNSIFESPDLAVSKNDDVDSVNPGSTTTYRIRIKYFGETDLPGAIFKDPAALGLSKVPGSIMCSSLVPNLCDPLNLPTISQLEGGGFLLPTLKKNDVYEILIKATVTATSGTVLNRATITLEGQTGNNGGDDEDTVRTADLKITKTDGSVEYTPGSPISYTMVVTNLGPFDATGVSVSDAVPSSITGTTINCVASGMASCGTNASSGNNVSYTGISIPYDAANFLTITVSGTVNPSTTGDLVNAATVTPGQQTDLNLDNNTATDTDTPKYIADLKITKTDGKGDYVPGNPITYTIVVNNLGPSDATGVSVSDAVPSSITGTTINCVASGTASCGANGNVGNNVSYTGISIPAGAANYLTITVSGTVNPSTTGDLVNTAMVTPGPQIDPNPNNNSDDDVDTIVPQDFSDAPSSYGAPWHIIDPTLQIGPLIDAESAPIPTLDASGDDLNKPTNDEDGIDPLVGFPKHFHNVQTSYSVKIRNVLNTTGSDASLYAWIDFDNDGKFEANEFTSTPVPNGTSGSNTFTLTWSNITFSNSLHFKPHYFRVRITTDTLTDEVGTDSDDRSNDPASNGEVEDYSFNDPGETGSVQICKQLAPNDSTPLDTYFTFSVTNVVDAQDANFSLTPGTCSRIFGVNAPKVTVTEGASGNTRIFDITAITGLPSPGNSVTIAKDIPNRSVEVTIPSDPAPVSIVTFINQSTAGQGTIEICKQLAQGDPIPVGTNFTFTVTGAVNPAQATITIPAGAFGTPTCTAPILVATGSQTITEVQRPNTIVSAITVNPSDPTDNIKLGNRSVTINVTESGVNDERVITFTNQTTRTGYLEICKDAQGPDVTGSFSFTVEGSPGNTYSVPVGACSLPIEVTIPQVGNSPFTAKVTELKKENYKLVDVTTSPTNALNGPIVFDAGFDANGAPLADNTNGGYVVVNLTVGGTANQKIVHFVNQAMPGLIKVCKITADLTNIPDGTLFTFTISGMKGPLPGTGATISFDVPAGPAPGYCAFAPETWIVGTPLFIGENGISTANTKPLPLDGNATGKGPNTQAALSVSSITSSTSFLPAPVSGYNFGIPVNPDFKTPIAGYKAYAAIAARNTTATMTFTNFVYRPAVLKLCKKSTSPTVPLGKPFNFTIEAKDPATSWPYPTQTITVPVGSCVFVNGPFPENVNFPGIGPFNYDTEIIVTETAAPGTSVSSITSPTGTVTEDLPNRKGTMRLNQAMLPNFLFNEMVFTNSPASGSTARRALSDFDGDGKSDIAVFRPTEGNWYWLSSQNSTVNAIHFGSTGDKIVPGDYDGDGKTDFAVWRPSNGSWYIQRSSLGFTALQFGTSGDLPAQADFDGDGKTDTAVFRPSNGTWYVMGSTAGFSAVQFGANGDKPVAADYDGDGKADIAVFRPSEGNWYVLKSLGGLLGIHFGISTDKVAPGDYDGDGKTDYAVYRDGSPGVWYLMRSTAGFTVVPFGTTGDIPAAGDFDGDGKTDVSVFRPSTGSWYLQRSTSGFSASQFGAASDKPVPAGYLPQQ